MVDYISKLILDLNCNKAAPQICSGQFDKGRKFEITVTSDGNYYDITGCSAVLKGVRSDNTHFAIQCQISNNKVIATIDAVTLSVRGITVAKIVLSDSSRSYSTQTFIIDVDSALEGDITADNNYSILNRLIEQIHALNESGAIIVDDTLDINSTNPVTNAAVTKKFDHIYSKTESKARFALSVSVLFDENDIPIKTSDLSTLSAGFATNNLNVKTAFVSSKVSYIAGGAFTGCTNLTDVYIDNIIGGIGIASSSIPDTATIHYVDDYNALPHLANALINIKEQINTKADAKTVNSKLDKKADKATTLSGYGITDAYTKTNSKSRFALSVSVLFDENDVPIKTADLYILSAGYATSNLNVKTAFISSKVTLIESGAFTGCSNLTDVYIDNINKQITIADGAIPDTATIHYVDNYNALSQLTNAVQIINNAKYNASNIESGHGDFEISQSSAERVRSANFEYQKIGDWVQLYAYVDFKAFTPPSAMTNIMLSNLPYVCKNAVNPREMCVTTQKKQMLWAIGVNSSSLTLLFLSTDAFFEGEKLSFSIRYKV